MASVEKYTKIWRQFTESLREVYDEIGEEISLSPEPDLHGRLRALYGIPYDVIRVALASPRVDDTSGNIGTITGLFFEQLTTALIVPTIRSHFPNVRIERNKCSSEVVRSVARDPDLYISENGKDAVVEFKVSSKKIGLERILETREAHRQLGIGYLFVGGYVSSTADFLHHFRSEVPWATFLDCSDRNRGVLDELPTLDDVVASLVRLLATE
jgi:hypothetical protein